jgi:hypothetical protein
MPASGSKVAGNYTPSRSRLLRYGAVVRSMVRRGLGAFFLGCLVLCFFCSRWSFSLHGMLDLGCWVLGRKCGFPRNLRTGPISPRGKNNDVRSLLTTVCRGISEGRSGDGTQARRTVGSQTHTGCRSPNSREGWQLVLKIQTEERASALNTSGRGSLLGTSDVMCGMCLSTKTGTVIEYSLGSCRGRKKVAQVWGTAAHRLHSPSALPPYKLRDFRTPDF